MSLPPRISSSVQSSAAYMTTAANGICVNLICLLLVEIQAAATLRVAAAAEEVVFELLGRRHLKYIAAYGTMSAGSAFFLQRTSPRP